MKLKKMLFGAVSVIGLILAAEYFNIDSFCTSSSCANAYNSILFGWLIMSALVAIIVLFLLRSKKGAADAWWKFARIAIPIILIISTLINAGFHHHPGGFMNMDDLFDIPAHIILYSIFIIGSVVQIVRGLRSEQVRNG